MNIEQHKKAMKFLRDKNILKEFSRNVNESQYSKGKIEEYIENVEDYDLINSAFDWSSTDYSNGQGHSYWASVHQEWLSYRRSSN